MIHGKYQNVDVFHSGHFDQFSQGNFDFKFKRYQGSNLNDIKRRIDSLFLVSENNYFLAYEGLNLFSFSKDNVRFIRKLSEEITPRIDLIKKNSLFYISLGIDIYCSSRDVLLDEILDVHALHDFLETGKVK